MLMPHHRRIASEDFVPRSLLLARFAIVVLSFLLGGIAMSSPCHGQQPLDDIEGLSEPERVDRLEQLWRTIRFGELDAELVLPLTDLLKDPSYRVRTQAVRVLEVSGDEALVRAWPRILERLEEPEEHRDVRSSAIQALGRLPDDPSVDREAILAVFAELRDDVLLNRVVQALGQLGWVREPGLTLVLDFVARESRSPRVVGLVALRGMVRASAGELASEARARVLVASTDALKAHDVDVVQQAALLLGELGPHAASAVPELLGLLDEPMLHARSQAVWALGEIGAPARSTVSRVEALRETADPLLRTTIEEALEKLHLFEPSETTP